MYNRGYNWFWDLESCLNGTVKVELEWKGGGQEVSVKAKPLWISGTSGANWTKGLSEGRVLGAWKRGWGQGSMEVAQAWARVGGAVAGPQRVYMWERKSSWKAETRKVVEGPGRVYSWAEVWRSWSHLFLDRESKTVALTLSSGCQAGAEPRVPSSSGLLSTSWLPELDGSVRVNCLYTPAPPSSPCPPSTPPATLPASHSSLLSLGITDGLAGI